MDPGGMQMECPAVIYAEVGFIKRRGLVGTYNITMMIVVIRVVGRGTHRIPKLFGMVGIVSANGDHFSTYFREFV